MRPASVVALALMAALGACGRGGDRAEQKPEAPAVPRPILARELMQRHDGPELRFRWSVAPEATLEPGLFRWLAADGRQSLDAMMSEARDARAAAARSGYPFHPYDYVQSWTPAAETRQLLVMTSETDVYTGGAHGNSSFAVAVWDRKLGLKIGPWELFDDEGRAAAALTPAWCAGLADERRRRREGAAMPGFEDCPPVTEQTLVPLGPAGRITAFRIIAAPYAAGPFVEGAYAITVDAAPVAPLVKADYRKSFG